MPELGRDTNHVGPADLSLAAEAPERALLQGGPDEAPALYVMRDGTARLITGTDPVDYTGLKAPAYVSETDPLDDPDIGPLVVAGSMWLQTGPLPSQIAGKLRIRNQDNDAWIFLVDFWRVANTSPVRGFAGNLLDGASYSNGVIVEHGGATWIVTADHTTDEPPSSDWARLSPIGGGGGGGGGELPITSSGDLIVGDHDGNPVRLPAGEWGQYLNVAFYDDGGDGGKELQWNYIPMAASIDTRTDQQVYPAPDGTITDFSLSVDEDGSIQALSLVVYKRPVGAPVYGRMGPTDWTPILNEAEYIIGFSATVAPMSGDALLVDYRAEAL